MKAVRKTVIMRENILGDRKGAVHRDCGDLGKSLFTFTSSSVSWE